MQEIIKKVKEGKELKEDEKIKLVTRLEKQDVRYGLVWEEHPEDVELLKETHRINVKELEKLRINKVDEQKPNLIIEGDNLHSLELLKDSGTKVDVIYIDPPYNTLNEKGFAYNDKMIDQNDNFRHSKWLSFMSKRLELARDLMTEDGVIFISIDDNEQAQLKLLCDSIFGENNFISNSIWESNLSVLKQSNYIRKDHEYIIVYTKGKPEPFKRMENNMEFTNIDNDPKGPWFSSNATLKKNIQSKNYYGIKLPNGSVCYRTWKFSEKEYKERKVSLYFKGGNVPRLKIYESEYDRNTAVQSSIFKGYGTTTTGTNNFKSILGGEDFEYPKPVKLVAQLINLQNNTNTTVLDFFAGSGTTGQAVMELNKEDGGNRRFILCTNNEYQESKKVDIIHKETDVRIDTKKNGEPSVKGQKELDEFETTEEYQELVERGLFEEIGICRAITYERNKRVIEGYTTPKGKEISGLPNNLAYYKVELEEKEMYDDEEYIFNITEKNIEIKEGLNKFENRGNYSISKNSEKTYIVNRDIVISDELIDEIKNANNKVELHLYRELKNDVNLRQLKEKIKIVNIDTTRGV